MEGALGAPTTTKDLGPILVRSYVYDEGRAPDPLYLLALPLAVPVDAMFAVPQAATLVNGDWQKHQEGQRAERTHAVFVIYGPDRSVLAFGYAADRTGAASPELLRIAAGLDAKAQIELGNWYLANFDEQARIAEGATLLCFAAKGGLAEAQIRVGDLYRIGKTRSGTWPGGRSEETAYVWYSVAAASGNGEAEHMKQVAAKGMTPERIAASDQQVAHWKDAPCAPKLPG